MHITLKSKLLVNLIRWTIDTALNIIVKERIRNKSFNSGRQYNSAT